MPWITTTFMILVFTKHEPGIGQQIFIEDLSLGEEWGYKNKNLSEETQTKWLRYATRHGLKKIHTIKNGQHSPL